MACPLCAKSGREQVQQTEVLFDDLVGTAEQRDWEGDAERLGSLEVKDQLDFRRLLDWQIGRLFTLQNPTSIDADQRYASVRLLP